MRLAYSFVVLFATAVLYIWLSAAPWWWKQDPQIVLNVLQDKNFKAKVEARQLVGIYEGPKSDRRQALQLTWELLTEQPRSVPGF